MSTIFFLNNFKDGGAKISDENLKNYFSSRNTINFHKAIFVKKFFKDVLAARNIVIMNFFSFYTLMILFLLLIIRKKNIYISLKGQLMPHALELNKFKKSLFIFFMRRIFQILTVKLIYTSFHEAIESKSLGAKECIIIGDLLSEQYSKMVNDIKFKVQNTIKYGYFGRIDPKKNIEFVFPILGSLGIRKFTLWGSYQDANYLHRIFNIANENDVEIDYRGTYSSDDFLEIQGSIDIFLMPTLAENFGYNILEAQLLGLQIFVSKGTTPWDCEFDNYNTTDDIHFVDLEKKAWVKELSEIRKTICVNDGRQDLLSGLCRVRDQQVREFAERLSQ